jgi:FtsP/CotA-like multicopper oxidase with cupredoxin domain
MYGTFLIDPPQPRPTAHELVMVMHGYNTTFDGKGNQLYAVNGIPFHYVHEPIQVRRGELVRIYLVNILEYNPINSFHLHGNFFEYYPTGTRLQPAEYTDTVALAQGQRARPQPAGSPAPAPTRHRPRSPAPRAPTAARPARSRWPPPRG